MELKEKSSRTEEVTLNQDHANSSPSESLTLQHGQYEIRDYIWKRMSAICLGLSTLILLLRYKWSGGVELGIIATLIVPMVAYLCFRIFKDHYRHENPLAIALTTFGLGVVLWRGKLSGISPDEFICIIPLGWAVVFSAYFLTCHKADLTPARAPLLFSAALVGIAICLGVWFAGGKDCLMLKPVAFYSGSDRFPYTFKIWESQPITSHYFLTFDNSMAPFETKRSYRGYTPFFTLLNYIPLRIVRSFTGLDYINLMRLTPFMTGALGAFLLPLSIIWGFRCSCETRARFLFLTVSTTSFLLLIPDLWTSSLAGRPDNCYPITALLQVLLAVALTNAAFASGQRERTVVFFLLALMALLLPIFGFVFAISVVFYWSTQRNHFFLLSGFLLFSACVLSFKLIYLLGDLAGLSPWGTSMWGRMGFEEHRRYSPIEAVISPTHQTDWRPWSFIFPGAIAAIAAVVVQICFCRSTRIATLTYLTLAPALWHLIIFPQSASIHPELYDSFLVVAGPVALLFALFGIIEEGVYSAHRFVAWAGIIMWGCMFNNIRELRLFLARF